MPLDLYVSGKRIGSTEDGQIIVPPGVYRVQLVSERLNYRGTVTLNVQPGRRHVTHGDAAERTAAGEHRTGRADLDRRAARRHGAARPLPVPIGTREVVVSHPDLGERREFVEVRFGDVTDVTIARRENIDRSKDYPLPNLSQPSAPIR